MNVMVRVPQPVEADYPVEVEACEVPGRAIARIVGRLRASEASLFILHGPAGYGKRAYSAALEQELRSEGARCLMGRAGLETVLSGKIRQGAKPLWVFLNCEGTAASDLLALSRKCLKACAGVRIVMTTDWLPASAAAFGSKCLMLRPADLKLQTEEIAELFRNRTGRDLGDYEATELQQQTGGWPVAVDACLSEDATGDQLWAESLPTLVPHDRMRRFTEMQIFSELPETLQVFLVRISCLDLITVELANAVLGRSAEDLLRLAIDEYALLERAPGMPDGYEIPVLLRRSLAGLGTGHVSGGSSERLAQAARWCEQQGRWQDAVEYFLRAGETELAKDLLVRFAPKILQATGDTPRTLKWIDGIEARGVHLPASLRLWRTWSLTLAFRLEEAAAELRRAEEELATSPSDLDQSFADRLWVGIAARRGEMELVQSKSEQWLETWPDREPQNAAGVCILLALAKGHYHDELGQRRLLMKAREFAVRCGNDAAHLWILGIEALAELEAGRASLALELSERAIESATRLSGTSTPIYSLMNVIAARMHLEMGDIAQAATRLDRGYHVTRQYGLPETNQAAKTVLTALKEHRSGCDAAIAALHQYSEAGLHSVDFCNQLATAILIRNGRIREARLRFEMLNQGRPADDSGAQGYEFRILEVMLLVAEQKYADASHMIMPLLTYGDSRGRARKVVTLLGLKAACEWKQGQEALALRTMSRLVSLAAAGSLHHTVMELGWALKEIIARIPECDMSFSRETRFLADLRSALGIADDREEDGIESDLVERLTGREKEILRWLDSSLKICQIAKNIAIGETTLKWHLRNIYDKLSVHNRSGAVAVARRYALI